MCGFYAQMSSTVQDRLEHACWRLNEAANILCCIFLASLEGTYTPGGLDNVNPYPKIKT